MPFAPCAREIYRALGAGEHHPNCRDNFFLALAEFGLRPDFPPDPINVFQNTPIDADGSYVIGVTRSRAGDRAHFRAECELIVVLTACAVDIKAAPDAAQALERDFHAPLDQQRHADADAARAIHDVIAIQQILRG